MGTRSSKTNKPLIICSVILLVTLCIAGGLFIFGKVYYAGHWYAGTYINEMDVSGMSLEEAKKEMAKELEIFQLTVSGRDDSSVVIRKEDIDLTIAYDSQFQETFEKQHEKLFLGGGKRYTVTYDVTYDEGKLADLLNQSDMVMGGQGHVIVEPKSATVKYSAEKKQYECIPEENGNTVIPENLLKAVKMSLSQADTELDISGEDNSQEVYQEPEVHSDDEILQKELALCNNAALRYIVWNMGQGMKEKITPVQIAKWISCKNGKIQYDNKAVSAWVEKLCLKYKTVGMDRQVKMHNGKTVTVSGGDYGWRLDYEGTVKQAKKALKKVIDEADTQAYIDDPSSENRKPLVLNQKVKYVSTAFQKDYTNLANDYDEQNHTEISLSKQMVYIIRDGKVAFSCKCISGKPVQGRETQKGAWFIKEHNEKRTLVGEDYETPVDWWVRITWTGTGFHSAPWQSWSRWSETRYITNGSHGCLNLAPEDAKKVYEMTKYMEAVFIY